MDKSIFTITKNNLDIEQKGQYTVCSEKTFSNHTGYTISEAQDLLTRHFSDEATLVVSVLNNEKVKTRLEVGKNISVSRDFQSGIAEMVENNNENVQNFFNSLDKKMKVQAVVPVL